jgi:hypothetical protein
MIANHKMNSLGDLEKVAGFVRAIAPNVRPFVRYDFPYKYKRLLMVDRPTFVYSPVPLKMFKPARGVVFQGTSMAKSQECEALIKAGVSVPRYKLVTERDRPDLTDLGAYVVVKPDCGARGALVRVSRSNRVKWSAYETEVSGKGDRWIAQEFIYTGPWPVNYRVTTLFGKVLWSWKQEADRNRPPLSGPEGFKETPGLNVVASSKGCMMALNYDPEIIEFAERAHAAFPDVPLLGTDVLRDATTGKLYVLEVNASGWVWHFSSPIGLRAQKEFGFSLERQFDGLRRAAHILATKACKLAR